MRNGFSLVELSIVLVILGLLTGGILTGQSLIRAAEMRSINAQLGQFQVAIRTFKDKYYALPGDITNATSFWGTATNCTAFNTSLSGGTCNGNGNGLVANNTTAPPTDPLEGYYFWHHLMKAGLIEGSYAGLSQNNATADAVAGVNVPSSPVSGKAGWCATRTDSDFYPVQSGNFLMLGNSSSHNAFMCNDGTANENIMTVEEAYLYDKKFDDGLPPTGSVRAGEFAQCTTHNYLNMNAQYALSTRAADKSCGLLFQGFF